MRQKLGAGRINSTATLVGPVSSFSTYTTRHSFCSPPSMFCMRSLCLGVTFSAKAINAPCALTYSWNNDELTPPRIRRTNQVWSTTRTGVNDSAQSKEQSYDFL